MQKVKSPNIIIKILHESQLVTEFIVFEIELLLKRIRLFEWQIAR